MEKTLLGIGQLRPEGALPQTRSALEAFPEESVPDAAAALLSWIRHAKKPRCLCKNKYTIFIKFAVLV
jgi:hypothetical protein